LTGFIDIYCERTAPGLWAEPLNAISNLAFFIAALAAFRLARRRGGPTVETGLPILLIVLIGIGSSLFHTLANRWSELADVLPILFYQLVFIGIYARRVMQWNVAGTAFLLALFVVLAGVFGQMPRDWFNGSLSYAPAFMFLVGLGAYHYRRQFRARATLLTAAAVFIVSLTFRSIDMQVCPAIPVGVHFLWHLLNAVVLFLTMRALLLNTGEAEFSDSR
jgi:Ceramidase